MLRCVTENLVKVCEGSLPKEIISHSSNQNMAQSRIMFAYHFRLCIQLLEDTSVLPIYNGILLSPYHNGMQQGFLPLFT